MSLASSTDGFALDVQGLDALKRSAHKDSAAGIKEASKQFEALFLQMMLKSMRAAIPKSSMDQDSQTSLYTEMLDQQWAQSLAGRGMGLADQLSGALGANKAAIAEAAPQAPKDSPFGGLTINTRQAYQAWKRREMPGEAVERAAHVDDFVARMRGPAQRVAQNSGIPAELILAQAALETDWGRRQITTASGADSHNLFGIKAGGQWRGATTEVLTTEYDQGQAHKQRESFRAYPSYDAAFADYARLIGNNDNYAGVLAAPNPLQAARALQQGGYATDPHYADKLISVMATIGPLRDEIQTARLQENR
ncbi:MAG: flagellar assembly peptidoglycan hydrolase FlgJ [Pseudomonas sp.]|uniref:flagellar assembly peptidoglycan hydrolase FlgJ n=1 Tax=Pseudomonas abieticivorans TaxID=2931382 RepID=UPI0020BFE4F2|nr:flagellar assembly peptidoglycan hydrolase FlgJ [Pseudomonas sp. PIA16]MDE1168394.1 flagellar assembly peptidoglycan hydrolase FlgJ [Pseudomonas sp.]